MLSVSLKKQLSEFQLQADFETTSGVTALFGPSGTGKTQLVRAISGLELPDEGRISLGGELLFERVAGTKATTNQPAHSRKIGYVFQDHLLFPHMNVRRNLTFGLATNAQLQFEEILKTLDIGHLLDRKPRDLSGGESQRVAIGRTLLSEPRLLIMDEPLSSLDKARKGEILNLIERIRDQFDISLLYITHALDEVMRLADHLILIERGQIRAHGPMGEILSRHDLFPPTGDMDVGSVLTGHVASRDDVLNLTTIQSAAGPLLVTGLESAKTDDAVRIRLRAKDIAISLNAHSDISTLNQLNGKITSIHDHAAGVVLVEIDVGVTITAAITVKSLQTLNLKIGTPIWALIKSVTVNSIEY